MQISLSLILLSVCLQLTYAAPTSTAPIIKKCSPGNSAGDGVYSVSLHPGIKFETSAVKTLFTPKIHLTHLAVINGFFGVLDEAIITKLSTHAEVGIISQNCRRKHKRSLIQSDAPWGISRLTSATKLTGPATSLTHPYSYAQDAGSCADIYVVDGGINIQHEDFGGRARHGKSFGTYAQGKENIDADGHGTFCAAIAGGKKHGVAKGAHIIAVKVSDETEPVDTAIYEGFQWIEAQVTTSARPSVVSYSIESDSIDLMLDMAAMNLRLAGIHVVAAAGNGGVDGANTSPARLSDIIGVGATDIDDNIIPQSNFGSVVDLYAPGKDITSAWIGSNSAIHVGTGTSAATAHVSGMVAIQLCRTHKRRMTVGRMQELIVADAKAGIQNVASKTGSHNRLAHLTAEAA